MKDSIDMAREFAIAAHGDQKYGDQPYVVHLDEVASIVPDYDLIKQAAYLHDVLEDTDKTAADLEKAGFCPVVVRAVVFCTDEPGANRKERKAKTYEKARRIQIPTEGSGDHLGFLVKLADRMANLRSCVRSGNTGLLRMYQRETAAFKEAYWLPGADDTAALWAEYDRILDPSATGSFSGRRVPGGTGHALVESTGRVR